LFLVDVFKFIMSYDPKLNLKIGLKVAGGLSVGKWRTFHGSVVKDSNFDIARNLNGGPSAWLSRTVHGCEGKLDRS
jgi:hypothetical protein